ncbi:MAG: dihydrodipicolinate synthase family protein [Spirochaetaceae bacterium]|nr:MAG: dihydrodipicolinate synthase family protein [Spirochaetaceae bacterium]
MTLEGVFPVLLTLFDEEEEIEFDAIGNLIEKLITGGTDGITIFGFGSEFYKLSDEERTRLLHYFIERVNGRVPTIVSVTSHSTINARKQAQEAEKAGASAIMLLPPFLSRPDTRSILEHLREVIKSVGIPVVVQYAPDETGVAIPAETFLELSSLSKAAVYVKVESTPAGPLVSRLSQSRLKVMVGKGGIAFFEALERGAVGVIPGCSMYDEFVTIFKDYVAGDKDSAFRRHNRIIPYLSFTDQSNEFFLAVEKYLLTLKGYIGRVSSRRPCVELENVHKQIIRAHFDELNI